MDLNVLSLPQDNAALALVFIAEVIQTVLREAIFISVIHKTNISDSCVTDSLDDLAKETNSTGAAIASLVITLLPIGLMLLIIALLPFLCCCSCCKDDGHMTRSPVTSILMGIFKCEWKALCGHSLASILICLLQCVLLVFYLFGDNIDYILHRYGANLRCRGDCQETVQAVAMTLSVLSAVLLNISPHALSFVRHWCEEDWKYEHDEFEKKLHILGTVVKIEAIYNALLVAAQHHKPCHLVEHILGWSILVACIIVGMIWIVVKFFETETEDCKTLCMKIYSGILLFFLIPAFFLSDNSQPLDCAFKCDPATSPSNSSMGGNQNINGSCCNINCNAITRLVLILIALVLTIALTTPVIAHLYYEKCKSRRITKTKVEALKTLQKTLQKTIIDSTALK